MVCGLSPGYIAASVVVWLAVSGVCAPAAAPPPEPEPPPVQNANAAPATARVTTTPSSICAWRQVNLNIAATSMGQGEDLRERGWSAFGHLSTIRPRLDSGSPQ